MHGLRVVSRRQPEKYLGSMYLFSERILFKQISGAAMSFPLSSLVLATNEDSVFIEVFEGIVLKNPQLKRKVWLSYVDDMSPR